MNERTPHECQVCGKLVFDESIIEAEFVCDSCMQYQCEKKYIKED